MNKEKARSRALNISAFVCFALSVVLLIMLQLLKIESIAEWYSRLTEILMDFEKTIENLDNRWIIILVIELNFLAKSVIPWVPISCICVISGVVFHWPIALVINISGLIMLFTVRYLWGKHLGGGNAEKILAKYKKAYAFIDLNRYGSPLMLFGFRFIPCLPINSISQLYGSLEFSFAKYLIISLVGFSYKLFSYTIIGRNVYDPLSAKFIVPSIMLFFISGIVLLMINGVIHATGATVRLYKKYSKTKTAGGGENSKKD